MKLPFHVIELLKRKSGNDLRLPADCEYLSLDIESRTGVRVGATTLKRLLGFAADERTPHATTLDVIARYLGYAHWQQLSQSEEQGNSGFDTIEGEVRSEALSIGAVVEITYLPDRCVQLRHEGNGHFRLVQSQNSKLLAGDEADIQNFVPGHPLLVANVTRDGRSLGSFTAGRVSGLTSVNVIH